MAAVPPDRFPVRDDDVATFVRSLGLDGLIDIHVHFLPERLQAAVWRYFDQLDDPPWPVTYRTPEPVRRRTLRELGVLRHTALAYAHRPGMAESLNVHTLALADEDQRIIPTFTFHAEDGAAGYVASALARGGAVAKVHLQVGRFETTDDRLREVWQMLAEARVPAVIHAGAIYGVDGGHEYCGADAIRALLERHPDVLLVVAHLGAPDVADFLALADEAPTLRFDTAMVLTDPPFLGGIGPDVLQRLPAVADRLLFGSDFPTIPHPYASQVRGLAALGLDEHGLRAVLHDNAAALLARRRSAL